MYSRNYKAATAKQKEGINVIYNKHGLFIRLIYLSISILVWITTLGGYLFLNRRVVLCYHGISDIQAKRFKKQMEIAASRVVPLFRKNHRRLKPWSRPDIVITFDDAFDNLLRNVLPIVKALEIPVSISRSVSFLWLCVCTPISINELIGKRVLSAAFPHGAHNDLICSVAVSNGLEIVLTLEEKLDSYATMNSKVGRFSMDADVWDVEFYLTSSGAYAWIYYFRRFLRKFKNIHGLHI